MGLTTGEEYPDRIVSSGTELITDPVCEARPESRHRLATDDSGHWYLIPGDGEHLRLWWEWSESQDARDGVVPDWAKRIDGLTHFTFTDPRED